ncbi:MAG: hypothetical protein J6R47_04565, partial [Acholeplasmatales bacterium]|nr:hypothetical protein [Acholeplasmatales bacterium]
MGEIEMLIDRVPDVLSIYENTYNAETGEIDILHMLDDDNPNALENEASLDRLIDDLCDSDLLGAVLSMTFVEDALTEALSGIAEGVVIPSDLSYTRQYDSNGNVISDGELYSVLSSLKLMMKNGLGDVVDQMASEEANQTMMISDIIDILLIEENGVSAIDNLLESKLLTYTLSHILLTIDLGEGLTIIVPDTSLEVTNDLDQNGNPYKVLKKNELKGIVSSISSVLPEEGEEMIDIKNIILKKDEILESDILHATIISFLVESLSTAGDELIIIPNEYKEASAKESLEVGFNNNIWYTSGEVSKVLDGIDMLLGITTSDEAFDFANIDPEKILGNVFTLTEDADGDLETVGTKLDVCYSSIIMKGTLTYQIDNALTNDLVDDSIKQSAKSDNYYKATEIGALIDAVNALDIDFNNIDESIITNTISKLNDDINPDDDEDITNIDICFKSSIFNGIVTKQVDNALNNDLDNTAVRDSTKANNLYTSSEVRALLDGIEVLGIDFNNIEFDNIQDLVLSLNDDADLTDSSLETKLDICYKSVLFQGIVSKQLDNVLGEEIIEQKNKNLIQAEYLSTGAKIFLKSDISDVISAIKTLGIEDLNSISLDSVKLSKDSISNIAKSKIIRAILDKNLSDSANNAQGSDALFILPNRARDYVNSEYTFLSEKEVNSLLTVLWDELGVDAGDGKKAISMDVDLAGLSITSSNIDSFTSSNIILSTISDKLSSYLYIPASALDTDPLAHPTDIKKDEIKKLIIAIEQFQPSGISINVNFDTTDLKLTRAKINSVTNSDIMYYALSSQIVDNIDNIPNEAYVSNSSYTHSGVTRSLISKTEISNLIRALQDVLLGSSETDPQIDIASINIGNANINITKAKINSIMDINRSYIVHNMVTDTITDSLVMVPKDAYTNSTYNYINASEVNAIIDLIGTGSSDNRGISVGGSSSLSFANINIDTNLIAGSSILRYKISEELLKLNASTILIPTGVVDSVEVVGTSSKSWIKESEIKSFLDGIATITGGSLDTSSMEISFPSNISL